MSPFAPIHSHSLPFTPGANGQSPSYSLPNPPLPRRGRREGSERRVGPRVSLERMKKGLPLPIAPFLVKDLPGTMFKPGSVSFPLDISHIDPTAWGSCLSFSQVPVVVGALEWVSGLEEGRG